MRDRHRKKKMKPTDALKHSFYFTAKVTLSVASSSVL